MNKTTIYIILLFANFMCAEPCFALLPNEGVVLDPATGNFLFSYRDGTSSSDPLRQIPFVPSTKIEPQLSSVASMVGGWNIRYEYTVANGANAKQLIDDLSFFGLPSNTNITGSVTFSEGSKQMDIFEPALTAPNLNWYGDGARTQTAGINIGWYHNSKTPDPVLGIQPGATLAGFSLISNGLPGLTVAQVRGNGTKNISFPDEGPEGEIGNLYFQLLDNDFVPRNAAAPMIAVPTPYDAAVTLENIQTHVHTWIAKQLLDTTFSAQLDTSFQAAIAAYRANQPQTAIIQLQTMRTLIQQQQPDADKNDVTPTINLPAPPALIDLLAARILYFDLGYVISR